MTRGRAVTVAGLAATDLPARWSSPAARQPAGGRREFERFRGWLLSVLVSSCHIAVGIPNTHIHSFFLIPPKKQNHLQAGGSNGSYNERRADPGRKGAARSHRERYGCWAATGRCLPGLGAWRSPGGAPGRADPPLRFCEVRGLAPGNSVSPSGLGPVAGAERRGTRRWDKNGGSRGSSPKPALERYTFPGPSLDYNERPLCLGPMMRMLRNSPGDFDHRLSWRQWPQVLRRVSKGPFRLPEAERSGSHSCPRPRLGVEGTPKEKGSL